MGESTNPRTTLRFDRRIRLEFHEDTNDASTVDSLVTRAFRVGSAA